MNAVQPETQETGEGGAVSASPLPVSPSPTGGAISHRYSVRGRAPPHLVPGEPPEESCFCPLALYPDYRHALPAPSEGGGRRPRSGREVGVVDSRLGKPFPVTRRDRGRGVPPPPRQPHPHGAIPHRHSAREEATFLPSTQTLSPRYCLPPVHGYPGQSPHTARPPG